MSVKDTEYQLLESESEEIEVGVNYTNNISRWLRRVYWYYKKKGFVNIILHHIFYNILQYIFVGFISVWLAQCINLGALLENKYLDDVVTCGPKTKIGGWSVLCIIVLGIKVIYECIQLSKLINKSIKLRKYFNGIGLNDTIIQSITFNELLDKIKSESDVLDSYTKLEIINLIMLAENYNIGLNAQSIIDYNIPGFKTQSLSKVSVWVIDKIINSTLLNKNQLNPQVLNPTARDELITNIQSKFKYSGILVLIFSPFIALYTMIYTIFNNTEKIKNQEGFLSIREYTQIAKLKFRDYNELEHDFEIRLNKSYTSANKYISGFVNHTLVEVVKFVTFVLSAFFAILLIMSAVNEHVLVGTIIGSKPTLWWFGIIIVLVAIFRALIPSPFVIHEPKKLMQDIVENIHYIPNDWVEGAHTREIAHEFGKLFKYRIVNWLSEIFATFVAPFVLAISIKNSVPQIIEWFATNTHTHSKIGHVCRFALFDDNRGGEDENKKIEQSVMGFKSHFPEWEKDGADDTRISDIIDCLDDIESGEGTNAIFYSK